VSTGWIAQHIEGNHEWQEPISLGGTARSRVDRGRGGGRGGWQNLALEPVGRINPVGGGTGSLLRASRERRISSTGSGSWTPQPCQASIPPASSPLLCDTERASALDPCRRPPGTRTSADGHRGDSFRIARRERAWADLEQYARRSPRRACWVVA